MGELMGQLTRYEYKQAGIRAHIFRNWGTSAMFEFCVVNLEGGSYLYIMSGKVLSKSEKENKYNTSGPVLSVGLTSFYWYTLLMESQAGRYWQCR